MEDRGVIKMSIFDIKDNWDVIGKLVTKHGTKKDKLAWVCCIDDAAEWRINALEFKFIKDKEMDKV